MVLDAEALAREAKLLKMSTLTEEGVMDVKQLACDRLLASRVEMKLQVRCHSNSILTNSEYPEAPQGIILWVLLQCQWQTHLYGGCCSLPWSF